MRQNRSIQLFNDGPAVEIKLFFLVLITLALIISDAQWRVFEPVRSVVSTAIYPFQRAVLWPRDLISNINDWSNAVSLAKEENEDLQRQRIELAQVSTHAAQLASENAQLRRLLKTKETVQTPSVAVEILYMPSNAFNQTLVFNKGSNDGVKPGMPVLDEGGVVGQIIRVTPMTSEAALITNESVSIPVEVLRNGLRLIVFGSGQTGKVEVRYLTKDVDVKEGDTLVTSGIGGIFPAGLSVAKVTGIELNSSDGFMRASAEPTAHPERYRHFLVLLVPTDSSTTDDGLTTSELATPAASVQPMDAPSGK